MIFRKISTAYINDKDFVVSMGIIRSGFLEIDNNVPLNLIFKNISKRGIPRNIILTIIYKTFKYI